MTSLKLMAEILRRFGDWDWCHCCGKGYWHEQVGTDYQGVLKFRVVKCIKHWKEEMNDKAKQDTPRSPSLVRAVHTPDGSRDARSLNGRSVGAPVGSPIVVAQSEDAGDTLGRAIRDFGTRA